MQRTICVTALVLMLCGAALAGGPEDALLQADQEYCKAVAAQRLDGWLSRMTDDVVTFGSRSKKGIDEVRATMQKAFDDADFNVTWEPLKAEIFPSGDMGYTTGRFTWHDVDNGKHVKLSGTYLTVWKKQKDGSWKVIADGGAPDEPVWKE
jgi:ketosteroid isomerase-like protein